MADAPVEATAGPKSGCGISYGYEIDVWHLGALEMVVIIAIALWLSLKRNGNAKNRRFRTSSEHDMAANRMKSAGANPKGASSNESG